MVSMRGMCYDCRYRGGVAGSAHSSCNHPAAASARGNVGANVLALLASVGRVAPITAQPSGIKVRGNPYGIAHGWFNWPWNFDPTWLEECDGFTTKIPEVREVPGKVEEGHE